MKKEKLITLLFQFLFLFFSCLGGIFVGTGLTYIIENRYWWFFAAAAGVSIGVIGISYFSNWIERKFRKDK